ncbi:F-box/LRR-repeat protein 12 [Tanacetum coccineum]
MVPSIISPRTCALGSFESCMSLRHVDLSCCSKITNNGIQCLNQNCHQLTKLGISGCDKILAILSGGEYLNISSRDKDPWECDVAAIWNLSGCDKIKDLGWQSIGEYCTILEILHADRCKNLSKRGLEALVDRWSTLLAISVIYLRIGTSVGKGVSTRGFAFAFLYASMTLYKLAVPLILKFSSLGLNACTLNLRSHKGGQHGMDLSSTVGDRTRAASAPDGVWELQTASGRRVFLEFLGRQNPDGVSSFLDVTPQKMRVAAEVCPGALLHNTTAQDTRERPLNVSFEK